MSQINKIFMVKKIVGTGRICQHRHFSEHISIFLQLKSNTSLLYIFPKHGKYIHKYILNMDIKNVSEPYLKDAIWRWKWCSISNFHNLLNFSLTSTIRKRGSRGTCELCHQCGCSLVIPQNSLMTLQKRGPPSSQSALQLNDARGRSGCRGMAEFVTYLYKYCEQNSMKK